MIIKHINRGCQISYLKLTGTDPNSDVGARINIPANEQVYIEHLEIENVFVGLVKEGSGLLKIGTLHIHHFGGDAVNLRGDNLDIETLKVHDCHPTRPYEEYHCDLFQAYNHSTKRVGNVRIHNIEVVMQGQMNQGFALTEAHDYFNFVIGTGYVNFSIDYKYGFFANVLRKSFVNVGNNGVKILLRKPTIFTTYDVEVKTYPDQLLVFDEGLIEEGKVIMTPVKNTKIALSAGHDRFRMHGAARGGIHENGFWNEFLDDLMPLVSNIPGVEVKRFHRPDQKPIGYSEAMRRLHRAIDGWGADVDIDLHFNAGGPGAKGHEVLHHTKSRGGQLAANIVDNAFDKYLNNRDRNRKPVPVGGRGAYGLRVGRSTSLITEAFFAKELPEFVRGGSQRNNLIQAYVTAIKEIANVDSQTAQVTQRTNATLTDDELNAAMALLA